MSVKRVAGKTGRPVKVPGEKSTKEKIFAAAVDLFAERGFDGVSVRDIARAVGIKESSVYKHYPGKDAILEAIFAYVEARMYAMPWMTDRCIDDALADGLSLQEILEGLPQFLVTEPYMIKITRIMIIEMYHNGKIRDYVRRELFERPVDETEAIFRILMERGTIRPCDPRALSTLFVSFLVYWYFQAFIFGYGEPLDVEGAEKASRAQIGLFADLLAQGNGEKRGRRRSKTERS